MRIAITSTLLSCALLTGCATMMEGNTDTISLATNPPSYANCTLKNEQGTWNANVPALVKVKKSKSPLSVVCLDQTTGAKGTETVQSDIEPWNFGNAATLGVGQGVDWETGAAYNYPQQVTVTLVTNMPTQAPVPGAAGYFTPAPEVVPPAITAPVSIPPALPMKPVYVPPTTSAAPMTYTPITPVAPAPTYAPAPQVVSPTTSGAEVPPTRSYY